MLHSLSPLRSWHLLTNWEDLRQFGVVVTHMMYLLKIQVDAWDLYTEIVKDHDYAGEVVSEMVEVELRIYVSEDDL